MKNITCLLFFCLSFQFANAMIIDNIIVSPLNSEDINIHLKVTEGAEFYFQNSFFSIANNSITLTVCYRLSEPQLLIVTTRENDFVIPSINTQTQNYTFIVIVNYIDEQGNCLTGPFSDTEVVSFSTPVTNAISLSDYSFNTISKKIMIIPNPTEGVFEVHRHRSAERTLYRKIKAYEIDEI